MNIIRRKPVFKDKRGKITLILENEHIEHAAIITFKRGAIRGNHYHEKSSQYVFVLRGALKLLTHSPPQRKKVRILKPGDLVFTPPLERHAFVALKKSEIIALTKGPRENEKRYEGDTFRLHGEEVLV